MTSVNYIKDDSGSTFIPSSQRPDGTWRRPIRVRDGYVPQEEQPLYVSKGKQQQEYRSRVPVGMTENDVSTYRTSSGQGSASQTSSSLYFDVGLYTPAPKATPIPGLNFVETEQDKVPSKSSKKKSKSKNKQADGSGDAPTQKSSAATTQQPPSQQKSDASAAAPAAATDPVKRLRNLRKRLKDIETLEKKIESGELKNPEKEQLEKINRKEEVEDEIDDLERLVEQMNLS